MSEQTNHTRHKIICLLLASGILASLNSCKQEDQNTVSLTPDTEPVIQVNTDIQYPDYTGEPFSVINNNIPFFTEDEITDQEFESYSQLDAFNRPGTATACLSRNTMPSDNENRDEIGMIKPAGWHTVKYPELISDLYLYNRCHLIGWQLSAENANEQNLITGTRYLNVTGMLPFENQTAEYIKNTEHHVMYRVTPVYNQDNLLCNGLLIEAQSVEDDDLSFCVYCYNVQPGIVIDYATGESYEAYTEDVERTDSQTITVAEMDYILNTNSKKIHSPNCPSVSKITKTNKQEYHGTVADLIDNGYEPCKQCNPE